MEERVATWHERCIVKVARVSGLNREKGVWAERERKNIV